MWGGALPSPHALGVAGSQGRGDVAPPVRFRHELSTGGRFACEAVSMKRCACLFPPPAAFPHDHSLSSWDLEVRLTCSTQGP